MDNKFTSFLGVYMEQLLRKPYSKREGNKTRKYWIIVEQKMINNEDPSSVIVAYDAMVNIVNSTECKIEETINLRLLPQMQFDEMLQERMMNFGAHLIENEGF